MVDNTIDPKDFRGWPIGTASFGYGNDQAGAPVRQRAGAMGKGTDASSVGGPGSVFISAVRLTQAEYDALGEYDPNVLYVIPPEE